MNVMSSSLGSDSSKRRDLSKGKAPISFKLSVTIYQSTRSHISEDLNLQEHRFEILKPHVL